MKKNTKKRKKNDRQDKRKKRRLKKRIERLEVIRRTKRGRDGHEAESTRSNFVNKPDGHGFIVRFFRRCIQLHGFSMIPKRFQRAGTRIRKRRKK